MKKLLLALWLLACAGVTHAELRLPQLIGSHMVLQQQTDAPVWGWADPGARITLRASWGGAPVETRADARGRWCVSLPTPAGGNTPYTLTVSDGESTLSLDDVLVGEVWFCSGQSNMEMPLEGFWNQPVQGSNGDIIRAGRLAGVRMVKIPRVKASVPQEEVAGGWERCTTATAPYFSATAFYFARLLNEVLDMPVGIINCSWGGSKIEGWMPRELVAGYPDVDLRDTTATTCDDMYRPTTMYNAMLYPVHRYAVRGFLWYQGCSNVGAHATYADRMAAMVDHWRALWGRGELPFYFVEIAPYAYGGAGDAAAYLREAQARAARRIPRSGMVSTSDLVLPHEETCIHPSRKREVGERLAALALHETYGYGGIGCFSPSFREMVCEADGSALLSFDHAETGFTAIRTRFGESFEGFEAAGADRVFRPAEAKVSPDDRRRIRVSLPDGTPVVAVRYGFHDWAPATVWSVRGLPLIPFRTDDWQ